jgi:hypothetical protein
MPRFNIFISPPAEYPLPESIELALRDQPAAVQEEARERYANEQRTAWACETAATGVNIGRALGIVFVLFIGALLMGGPRLFQLLQDKILTP